MKKEFLEIGKVVGTHGVRGMIRIEPWADNGAFLKKFNIFYLEDGTSLKLSRITPHGNVVIAAVDGVDSIDAAEKLRNKVLQIKRSDIVLPKGKYFISEILSSKVYNRETGDLIGILSDVFKTGANDVWVISDGDKEYLVPVIDDNNADVDIDNGIIKLTLLKGIMDDEN